MIGWVQDDKGWNGKVTGRDGTTEGFLKDFDAMFGDDPTPEDIERRESIPDLLRKDGHAQ